MNDPAAAVRALAHTTVSTVRAAFDDGRTRSLDWRVGQLRALEHLLSAHEPEIEEALAEDLGRARTETFLTEIYAVRQEVRALRSGLRRWARDEAVGVPPVLRPGRSWIRREPIGTVLVIGAWNYPFNLTLCPLAAAIAAGNAAVVKPSENAPASASLLHRLIGEHLDPQAVACLEGDGSLVEALVESGVDHVFYTGGALAGRLVAERAAQRLVPVTLELGGKSPAIVAADADLDVTARRIAWGKLLNAGQTCVAPDYAIVASSAVPDFLGAYRRAVTELYGSDPRHSPDYGRIVNDRHLRRIAGLLEGHGGEVVVGGEIDAPNRYVAPTVVLGPEHSSPLMSEEIFGPVLPVLAVETLDAACAFVSARPVPLALYAFTTDDRTARRILDATRSGTACVNTTVEQFASSRLPFGGIGPSGMGRYHGRFGYETFSQLRPVLERPTRPDLRLGRPPYGSLKSRLVRSALSLSLGRSRPRR